MPRAPLSSGRAGPDAAARSRCAARSPQRASRRGSRPTSVASSPSYLLVARMGSAPQSQKERDEIVVCVAGLASRTKQRFHFARERKLDAVLVGGIEDEIHVFLHQSSRERCGEIVVEQCLGLVFDERRPYGGSSHYPEQVCARHTSCFSQHECLGDQL